MRSALAALAAGGPEPPRAWSPSWESEAVVPFELPDIPEAPALPLLDRNIERAPVLRPGWLGIDHVARCVDVGDAEPEAIRRRRGRLLRGPDADHHGCGLAPLEAFVGTALPATAYPVRDLDRRAVSRV